MDSIGCVVIGAGVVGLACARALASSGREVVVIEAASSFGTETSSRNSEVVHAGIYYRSGSLKARTCVEGARQLYAYCEGRRIDHSRCGKLIVATDEQQRPAIEALRLQGLNNGVERLQWLDAAAVRSLEPELMTMGGLYSPDTGIVDSHGLMLALLGDVEACGGAVAFGSKVVGGLVMQDGPTVLRIADRSGETSYQVAEVINCAGLSVETVLRSIDGFPDAKIPHLSFAKGNYYAYSGASPFQRLVYPAPEQAGLGVHATLDLAGRLRFGPDVEWIDRIDYGVDEERASGFYAAIRKYWPDLPDGSLAASYAGIRPKLAPAGQPASDFVVDSEREHGVRGWINLMGIESPGLTASFALADHVLAMLDNG